VGHRFFLLSILGTFVTRESGRDYWAGFSHLMTHWSDRDYQTHSGHIMTIGLPLVIPWLFGTLWSYYDSQVMGGPPVARE